MMERYVKHRGGVTNHLNTVGYLPLDSFEYGDVEYRQVTYMDTWQVLEWAKLLRYYEPDSFDHVEVGLIESDTHPDVRPLAARKSGDDYVVVVAPRTPDEGGTR